ncbi:flagellar brake protein [Spirochaeta africana]|uniref:Putative glycosyltransferase n=1 Tax=Spirochaeta africana (strain ATCC 700263 / DSM 8902 / Z-7692) TaxID=889378 RepID=H9UG44_SPIAZ|nr:flagellar brake protein [Spirochaeta africana]AFG36487.1 putative glycosyltransferase [Spirochaeta africana DSM 8902]
MRAQQFYEGFVSSPLEVGIAFGFLALFIGFFIVTAVVRGRRERQRIADRSRQTFERLITEKGLSRDEADVIRLLAGYMRTSERKYMLLLNQGLFDACAQTALETGELSEDETAVLRVKLGFRSRAGAALDSSTQIPKGAPVILQLSDGRVVQAQVRSVDGESLCTSLPEQAMPLRADDQVEVTFHHASGVYAFTTEVRAVAGDELRLRHSEHLQRVQRRRYYRRTIAMPAFVQHAGTDRTMIATRFIDLSAGGASLENPGRRFAAGEDISISFQADTSKMLHVIGRIVRTSRGGRVMHVDFRHLQETLRDRLYRIVFRS